MLFPKYDYQHENTRTIERLQSKLDYELQKDEDDQDFKLIRRLQDEINSYKHLSYLL